ncbi:MAG TPA: TonB-dependent siderophore receptor [Cellvibrio sp.]|nr:TonB-dependent siderophore receptor [Cellvibrio sp.]
MNKLSGKPVAHIALCSVSAFISNVALAQVDSNLEEVVVFGRVEAEQNLQVPQTVDVLDEQLLTNLGVDSVGEALRFIPGASRDGSELDAFGDTYLMHGFYSSQTVNGIGVNRLNSARDSVNIERIEVLKGPASVLYGQLQPGAVVNLVTKQPQIEKYIAASIEGSRFNQYRATLDATGALGSDEKLTGRITAAYEDKDSFIDFWHKDQEFLSVAMAYEISDRTNLSLDAFHDNKKWNGFYNGMAAEGTVLPNPNGNIAYGTSLTDPAWNPLERRNSEITLKLTHQFNDALSYRGVASWTKEHVNGEEIFGVLGWEDENLRNLTRALQSSTVNGDAVLIYNDLSFTFNTGDVKHEMVSGFDYTDYSRKSDNDISLTSSLDLFTPSYEHQTKPDVFFIPGFSRISHEDNDTYGMFLQDRIHISESWRVVLGARYAGFDQNINDYPDEGDATLSKQSPTEWTTQFGLLYTPTDFFSLFANRSSSFLPVQGTTSNGDSLDPETGTQYELGAKAALFDQRVTATVSLFELTRGDVAVSDRDNPSALIPIGEQRARGLEASLRGELTQSWNIYLAYGYTDAETTEDTNNALIGKPIRNVPKNTLALATDYLISDAFNIGTAINYVDERTGDTEGTFTLPDYWRVDAFASYTINQQWQLRLSVDNLTNEKYYEHAFSLFEVWPGAPRTVSASVKATF